MTQIELFDDIPKTTPGWSPESICAKCEHIIAVRFSHSNLFFCTIQKGGKYGKKIRKNAVSCMKFEKAKEDVITLYDGYYGGTYKPLSRGK